jgi:hypothetical protein
MKINKNTRIRVDKKIAEELGMKWWDRLKLKHFMEYEYGMVMTSTRNYSYYFEPVDKQKVMLFIVAYGHLLREKVKNWKY